MYIPLFKLSITEVLVDLVSTMAVRIIFGNEFAVLPTRLALSWMEILCLTKVTRNKEEDILTKRNSQAFIY